MTRLINGYRPTVSVRRVVLIAGALVLVIVTASVTLLVTGGGGETKQPPGCAPRDRERPGCRPTRQSTGQTVALVTVIATPVAAAVVALVGVLAAQRRQEEQLRAERERLNEEHRLERRLSDLSELRVLLDVASEALGAYGQAYVTALTALTDTSDQGRAVEDQSVRDLEKLTPPVIRSGERLALRLGKDHVLVAAYRKALGALEEGRFDNFYGARPLGQKEAQAASEKQARASEQNVVFVDLAYTLVQSRLPEL